MSNPSPPPAAKRGSMLGGPVALVLLLFVAGGAVLAYVYFTNQPPPETQELTGLRQAAAQQEGMRKLADGYTDANGDLLADPPAGNFLNPDVLVFAEIPTADFDKDLAQWQPFLEHLSRVTGKKVEHWKPAPPLVVENADGELTEPARRAPGPWAQMTALKSGELHITAFNTGAVTAAVNTAGFIPLVCPANTEGKYGYEMEILVPADSPVQKPEDLRGKTVALVSLSSNSGGRAGLVYLKSIGLSPGRDYKFLFTGTHAASIQAVANGRVDAACVANDLLRSEIDQQKIKPEQYRSVYKSATFPPLCFGIGHNLEPGLVAKVREAFTGFDQLSRVYPNLPDRARFAAVDYQRDWAYVRESDEKLKTVLD